MGTLASPNLVLPLIDLDTGALDTGETVVVVLHGGAYPGDGISVPEIGTTGYYKIETAGGVAALAQGIYEVYVGGTFKAVFVHGHTALQDHADSIADPHSIAAAQTSIVDTGGYFSGTDIEAALQEMGAALAAKADAASTVLLDNSAQSVDAAKPKVGNLDADQVDGADAGNAAGNVLKLDGNGLVPLANIPDNLTGKNADRVDGAHVGTGSNNLVKLTATQVAGRLDTTILGKGVGSTDGYIPRISGSQVAGKVDISLLGKGVGSDDDHIPQISTDDPPETGKVHKSLLGMAIHRTASKNVGDTPAPDPNGGGSIWAEASIPNNTDQVTLDANIDWRDRMITMIGYIEEGQGGAKLPGEGDDGNLDFSQTVEGNSDIIVGGFYSRAGREGPGLVPGLGVRPSGAEDHLYFWVDASDGYLKCGKITTSNASQYDIFVRVDYSPVQNHI